MSETVTKERERELCCLGVGSSNIGRHRSRGGTARRVGGFRACGAVVAGVHAQNNLMGISSFFHLRKPDVERGARHDSILVLNHHDVQGATAAGGREWAGSRLRMRAANEIQRSRGGANKGTPGEAGGGVLGFSETGVRRGGNGAVGAWKRQIKRQALSRRGEG